MSSIKNTINLYSLLSNTVKQKGLKMHLNKLDLHNRLILTLNKKIEKFPHNKISDKLGGSLNQNIVFNFNNKNFHREGLDQSTTRLSITNNVVKIITSFFKGLGCLIARPQFIYKTDKLIVRIFYYQNNFNKNPLFSNNKSNFIYNLFNGTGAAKAQNSAPKSQNFAAILKNMLGQTKWNKVAQTIFNNNKAINTLELASISKKVFILFIKDLINLKSSNKALSIEKALTQLAQRAQKGASGLDSILAGSQASQGLRAGQFLKISRHSFSNKRANKKMSIFKNNQLLINLISSTNSESLTRKRTRLSKTFFNKTLLAKLIKKINNHNNNLNLLPLKAESLESKKHILPKELIGKGLILNPINKKKLAALLAWSNIDLSVDYKTIATALLLLINYNKIEKNTLNVLRLQNILANKINKNLTALSTQFVDEASKNINFIIKKTHPTFLIGTPFNTKVTKITNSMPCYPKKGKGTLFSIRARFNQGFMLGPKIIKLINKQLGLDHVGLPSLVQEHKDADKLLMLIKESFKAYNYGLNSNKNGFTPFNILCTEDNVKKFKLLGSLLTKIFKKNIDLQIIKMHNVGLQENIIAKAISENTKFDKSSVLIKKLLRKIAISNASLIQFNKQNKILNNDDLIYNSVGNLNNIISVPVFKKLKIKEQGVKLINTISNNKKNINLNQLYDQTKKVNILHTNPLALGKLVGIKIRIAGRLQKEPIRPKQTVKIITIGSLSKEKSNSINLSSFTSKNKKGTFRVSVKMAHIRTFSSF